MKNKTKLLLLAPLTTLVVACANDGLYSNGYTSAGERVRTVYPAETTGYNRDYQEPRPKKNNGYRSTTDEKRQRNQDYSDNSGYGSTNKPNTMPGESNNPLDQTGYNSYGS